MIGFGIFNTQSTPGFPALHQDSKVRLITFILLNMCEVLDCFCNQSKSSVMRQKGKSQNGGNKKAKHAKIPKKRTFLTPWYAHVHVCNDISVARKLSSVKMELTGNYAYIRDSSERRNVVPFFYTLFCKTLGLWENIIWNNATLSLSITWNIQWSYYHILHLLCAIGFTLKRWRIT